jgi:hypothetical protein
MSEPIRFLMVGGTAGGTAGELCVDGGCGPVTPADIHQPEYVDHDLGTGASVPADAGEEDPSSGG